MRIFIFCFFMTSAFAFAASEQGETKCPPGKYFSGNLTTGVVDYDTCIIPPPNTPMIDYSDPTEIKIKLHDPAAEAAERLSFQEKIKNMKHSGKVFKQERMDMIVGQIYRATAFLKPDIEKRMREVVIQTAPCDMKFQPKRDTWEGDFLIQKGVDALGGSSSVGTSKEDMDASLLFFANGNCDGEPYLLADYVVDGKLELDIMRINLSGGDGVFTPLYLSMARNTKYSGLVFKQAEMTMKIGQSYKMSAIMKSGLNYGKNITIATAPCDITMYGQRPGWSKTFNLTKEKDEWGGSMSIGENESDRDASFIKFINDNCDGQPFLYAYGQWGVDFMKIRLAK